MAADLAPVMTEPLQAPALPEAAPGSAAAAHARMAEVLGLHAIRCYVGPGYEGLGLVDFRAVAVEGAWLTALVEQPRGGQSVAARVLKPKPDGVRALSFQPVFQLRWGESGCVASPREVATLVVQIEPAAEGATGFQVRGCGSFDYANEPLVRLEVAAAATEPSCTVEVVALRQQGSLEVRALRAGEERVVHVALEARTRTPRPVSALRDEIAAHEKQLVGLKALAAQLPADSAGRREVMRMHDRLQRDAERLHERLPSP